ncbi:hypothetical protein AB2709_14425 [Klebsiella quasipneumoniae]|uniref:hypothetical protein n=1 Tax=Klebsiella quasipneumoniae TaxID=1463165 RepID=UPI00346416AD
MSFTLQKTVTPVKTYPSLRGAAINGEEESHAVVYSVTSVSLSGNHAYAEYTVTPEGASFSGNGVFEFTYSGEGNPTEEAERKLKDYLLLPA